jgi:hypothetical protein
MFSIRSLLATLLTLALASTPVLARGQNEAPPPPPPPPGSVAPNGQYVAPLQQTTQPTYVPQSVALSGPRMIKDWDETQPIPMGYHAETRVRKGLIISGAVMLGVAYLYSALTAAIGADIYRGSGQNNPVAALFVPVAGPFIEIGYSGSATGNVLLVIDGLLQASGAAMIIGGIAAPKMVLVRNDLGSMSLTPLSVPHGTGMALTFNF